MPNLMLCGIAKSRGTLFILSLVIACLASKSRVYAQAFAAPKWSRDVERLLNFEDEEQAGLKTLAESHDELATLYADFGRFASAIGQYQNALRCLGERDAGALRTAEISNHLAQVYLEMGLFAEAGKLLKDNVDRLTSLLPNETASTARKASVELMELWGDTLELQAEFLRETGDFERAEGVYLQVLEQRKKFFGESDRHYLVSLHNLGIFEWRRGGLERAEALLREELKLTEALSPGSTDAAHSRESLALVLTHAGNFAEAESHYRIAKEIYVPQPASKRDLFRTLNNVGYLHIFTGRHEEALELLTSAAAGRLELLGEHHLDYADSLNDLARLHFVQGKNEQALEFASKALTITRWNLDLTSSVQSERQQLGMSALFRDRLDLQLCIAAKLPESAAKAFAEIHSWKGAVLLRQRAMRMLATNDQVADQFQRLQRMTMRIASLSRTVPTDPELVELWKYNLADMKIQKERLEAEISQFSAELRAVNADNSVQRLTQQLPEGCVLVDFFQYNDLAISSDKGSFEAVPSLMASIVLRSGSVFAVNYGPVEPISRDIDEWRNSLGTTVESLAAGSRLRDKLWLPLLPHIERDQTILVSLDGALGRLPIDALPGVEPNTYLIEQYRIATVPVPQLIPELVERVATPRLEKQLLVMGDVDYGGPVQSKEVKLPGASLMPWERRSTATVRGKNSQFTSLAQTAGEIAYIERLFKNQSWAAADGLVVLDRSTATESRFRELAPQCYQLHLATHGFFAAPYQSADETRGGLLDGGVLGDQATMVRGISPGLLSGLAFTGANNPPQIDQDDGILTADEIACLPLQGVELVVLSACETGLGEVAGGEGLIGIQRAFQVSGARTTVASLWQVPDLATRLLMERFYENYWDKQLSRINALREAKLWMLQHPEAIRGVARKEQEHPSIRTPPEFWAAFVLSGDWR